MASPSLHIPYIFFALMHRHHISLLLLGISCSSSVVINPSMLHHTAQGHFYMTSTCVLSIDDKGHMGAPILPIEVTIKLIRSLYFVNLLYFLSQYGCENVGATYLAWMAKSKCRKSRLLFQLDLNISTLNYYELLISWDGRVEIMRSLKWALW